MPSASAFQPITLAPLCVTIAPSRSVVKSPALVKYVFPALLTTKNLSPLIIKSHVLSVLSDAPCAVGSTEIAPTVEPRPICFALVPPFPEASFGPVATCVV